MAFDGDTAAWPTPAGRVRDRVRDHCADEDGRGAVSARTSR
jgi:hypothetical protein